MTDHEKHDDQLAENLAQETPASEEEIQRIMAGANKESNMRQYFGVPKLITRWLCVAFTVYVLIINNAFYFFPFNRLAIFTTLGHLPPQVHRSSFVALLVLYAFMLYPARKKHSARVNFVPWYDVI